MLTSNWSPTVVLTHPRDPGYSSGTGTLDVEEFLNIYERVSAHNQWDNTNIGEHHFLSQGHHSHMV